MSRLVLSVAQRHWAMLERALLVWKTVFLLDVVNVRNQYSNPYELYRAKYEHSQTAGRPRSSAARRSGCWSHWCAKDLPRPVRGIDRYDNEQDHDLRSYAQAWLPIAGALWRKTRSVENCGGHCVVRVAPQDRCRCSWRQSMRPPPQTEAYLAEAVKLFNLRTKPDSAYATPLLRTRLRGYWWGHHRDLFVELMPSLVLRVRDPRSGQILAQSVPGHIEQLAPAPSTDFDARQQLVALDRP